MTIRTFVNVAQHVIPFGDVQAIPGETIDLDINTATPWVESGHLVPAQQPPIAPTPPASSDQETDS